MAEIEHALSTLATVQEAVVMASEGPAGDHRLVAYVVPAVVPAPTASVLGNALRTQLLPTYGAVRLYIPWKPCPSPLTAR